MLDPDYHRTPRNLDEHEDWLREAEDKQSWADKCAMTEPFAMWPQRTALSIVPLFHWLLQICSDSLHVLDGGVTMRHIILMGNWVYKHHGRDALDLFNERLAALPLHDEFKQFNRALFALDSDNKGRSMARFGNVPIHHTLHRSVQPQQEMTLVSVQVSEACSQLAMRRV